MCLKLDRALCHTSTVLCGVVLIHKEYNAKPIYKAVLKLFEKNEKKKAQHENKILEEAK